jgi:hypothetical protein
MKIVRGSGNLISWAAIPTDVVLYGQIHLIEILNGLLSGQEVFSACKVMGTYGALCLILLAVACYPLKFSGYYIYHQI